MIIDAVSPQFSAPTDCPICNRHQQDGVTMTNSGVFDGLRIECPQCGTFVLVGEGLLRSGDWPPAVKSGLSCAARQASNSGNPIKITTFKAAVEIAEAHTRTRVNENIDRLLFEIAAQSVRPGGAAEFDLERDFTLIDCFSKAEFRQYMTWTDKRGLATWGLDERGPESLQVNAVLTMDGWDHVQPMHRPGGIPGRCFVAMWFSDQTHEAYESGIRLAVQDAGFEAIRIDQKEHNNEITDEIMAEIRNCQLMVADFTGQRAGVYYEAGFAIGLGRPVIWCCRRDEIGSLHFDTNHKNHIDWQTPEELRERLYRRIRATILEQG
jgi:nucleoside 2-deoxyribosyltransferase